MPTGRSQKEDRHQYKNGNNRNGAPFNEAGVAVVNVDMGFSEFVIVTLQSGLLGFGILQMYIHQVGAVQDVN